MGSVARTSPSTARRRAQEAIAEIHHFTSKPSTYEWVIEGDIKACFDNVDHHVLMELVGERVKDRKVLRLVSAFLRTGVVELHGGFAETLTGTPQGGVASPLLANIYLSILDRHFSRIWDKEMNPPWRRQYRRRTGRPNYRLVRYADDFVVLVHGTKSEAEALKTEIGDPLASRLKMTLSDEKTHITHIDDGFVFLGFHIQRRSWGDGRRVVLTIPSKQALASAMHKIKNLTGRSTTSLSWRRCCGRSTRSFGAGLPISATAHRKGRSPTSAGMRGGGCFSGSAASTPT